MSVRKTPRRSLRLQNLDPNGNRTNLEDNMSTNQSSEQEISLGTKLSTVEMSVPEETFRNIGNSQPTVAVESSKISSSSRRRILELELVKAKRLFEIEKQLIVKQTEIEIEMARENSTSSKQSNIITDLNMTEMSFKEKVENWKMDDDDWPLFISQFKESTRLYNIPDEENILRLQYNLKGRARESIQPLLISPKNVSKIIETLELTFGRPEFIISALLDKVRRAPSPKEGKFETFLPFSNAIENLVITMENFDHTGHMSNPQILSELILKLPPFLRLRWAEETLNQKPNLKIFSEWIRKISLAAASCSEYTTSDRFQVRKNANVFVLRDEEKSQKTECPYCKNNHDLKNCQKIKNDDVETRWLVVSEANLCFSCLRQGHRTRGCKSKKVCGFRGCMRRHHNLLHKDIVQNEESKIIENLNQAENQKIVCFNKSPTKNVLLRMIAVKLMGPNCSINTYALCDEGSTSTLIQSNIAEQLGLEGKNTPFCMQWANNIVSHNDDSKSVALKISGTHQGAKVFKLENVKTIKDLQLPEQSIRMRDYEELGYLNGLPLEDMISARATILIGQDNIHLTVARKVFQGSVNSPIATKTHLGWILHGNSSYTESLVYNFHICCFEDDLNRLVKESFSTESFGVSLKHSQISSDEKRAIMLLEKTTKKLVNENRYETGLLWKRDDIQLPNNKDNAYSRLLCVERKMKKDKKYAKQYVLKIEDYLNKGYVRKLKPEEAVTEGPRTWYLPHFGVQNPNKPNKFRLVFDAAAKVRGVSLNDNLLQGPDYLNSLPGVLMRFRKFRWGFCGDIAEMFHQVKKRKEDRDSLRFLWRGENYCLNAEVFEMQVMIFGATCSPCSAQFVKNINGKVSNKYGDLSSEVENNFYVDDYLDSCDCEDEALDRISKIIQVNREAGFEVVGWVSNSPEVCKQFSKIDDKVKELNKYEGDRILGMWWNVVGDDFMFKIAFHKVPDEILNGVKIPTKKEVLRLTMSVFDPLGFLVCLTVQARMIIQQIWRCGIGWEDSIPPAINDRWLKWLSCLKTISSVRVPRCYSTDIPLADRIEIHIFGDASEEAFASVAYLRVVNAGKIDVAFLNARAKVSPLKPLSIPRLELQAAVMSSRMLNTIRSELKLPIMASYLWSDSQTVLCWIRGDGKNYKPFVSYRIGEIQELTNHECCWRYVPTKMNVADEATRFNESIDLSADSRWFKGPPFLYQPEEFWPENKFHRDFVEDEERKGTANVFVLVKKDDYFPNVERFSKWPRLVRSTAWILRFCNNLLAKDKIFDGLTIKEIEKAELLCLKKSQEESFGDKFGKLNKNSRLSKFSAYLDNDDLLRMRGRTNMATCLEENTKNPLILDPKSRYVQLLIQYFHEKYCHQGVELVLNELRQKYWIIKGRAAVKHIFANCLFCKRRKSKPEVPLMGQLPTIRLTPGLRAFTHTGLDYFGHLYVTVGRHKEKRYGVLFTCMATRAIHLEIAHSLTTDSAIMAIRRMIARRGPPKAFYSDNGTNLKGASEELKKSFQEMDNSKISLELSEKHIEWHFIPPLTPHMGGCWERLIGSVKKILAVTLKEEAPKDEVLLTLFGEAENIVNSRPLTHVSSDPSDPECLTPNHFLLGSSGQSPCPGRFEERELRKQWRKSQRLADTFWTKWIKEYLPSLNKRAKWTSDSTPLKIGDIVVIVDSSLPRNSWPIGKIESIFPGKDGLVRVVEVKTSLGIFRRPVTKICKIV